MDRRGSWERILGVLVVFGGAFLAAGCDEAAGPDEGVRFTLSSVVSQDGLSDPLPWPFSP